jgi:hypothetical protein
MPNRFGFHREQKTKQLPYRRLLSTIPVHGGNRRDLEMSGPSESGPEESQDALASAKHISSLFKPAAGKRMSSSNLEAYCICVHGTDHTVFDLYRAPVIDSHNRHQEPYP